MTNWKYARRLGALAALVIAATGGCSSAGSMGDDAGGGGDHPSNGSIKIDESKLVGTATGGKLSIDIPVQALGAAASGSLDVAIRSVDGSKTLQTTRVSYNVPRISTGHVTATFDVPADVTTQADWVRETLRIGDGSSQGLRVTTSLLRVMSPYDIQLDGPQTLSAGKNVSYRVHAEQPFTHGAIAGLDVTLDVKQGATVVATFTKTTDGTGDAVFPVQAPAAPGDYTVLAETTTEGTSTSLDSPVTIAEPGRKVLLTTDKPMYQPGQTIYLRALALAPPENTPLANKSVRFEIEDGKGNKILQRDLSSDSYGIASTHFTLGRILNMGTFKVRTIVDGTTTEKTVEVSRYSLPKYSVGVTTDKGWYSPGETLVGSIDAGYFFGKPVAGADVVIEGVTFDVGETVFQKVVGKTDATGKLAFTLTMPSSLVGLPLEQGNALVDLRTTVTDSAGQQVTKETPISVAQDPLRVVVVPEATTLVRGITNRLDLFVSDPLGAPVANATAKVQAGLQALTATTDAFGQAQVDWTPTATDPSSVDVTVTPTSGKAVHASFTFDEQAGSEHVLVRTDKAVYDVGDTVKVQVLASAGEAHAYVDWLNEGQAVDMRTLDLDASGAASFTMPVDSTLLGTNRVEAYVVDNDGNVVRSGRMLFARTSSALNVSLSTDKPQYKPGQPAKLTFSVTDEKGAPAVAALGVQVVDEAVFSLIDAQPGLLSTYFELEDTYSQPKYEIQAPPGSLPDLLFDKTRSSDPAEAKAAQERAAAALAALGNNSFTGLHLESWSAVISKANTLLQPYYDAERTRITALLKPTVTMISQTLAAEGCSPQSYWCDSLQTTFAEAVLSRLKGQLSIYDFWGNRYQDQTQQYDWAIRLHTLGPDEKATTADDADITIQWSDLGIDNFYPPMNGGGDAAAAGGSGGGGGFSGGGGAAGASGGSGGDTGSAPRIRKDFPETLYVNPEIITGPDGKATVNVDMADSITEWRVSTLAHSAGGKLGGGQSGIKVFQDFFADISFPATLTRGDEIEFPIAVYNYLTTKQSVKLELASGSWYTALGPTSQTVDVDPGQVVGVRFPVRVDTVGLQTLTVTATGSAASDALARQVLVVPDGKEIPAAISGALSAGSASHAVDLASNAIPGSQEMYLEVYPAFLSQVVTGMDSMLQEPYGCFEQTTSTTWPNVLVTRYMTQTGQITPAIQLKAESLISTGYQRLLTFEHTGGGFSWFGMQDPAPYLSVTAFGLMEFADMNKVQPVDPAMVARTQAWLVAQQKADGSWEGDQSEFFTFQTSTVRNTAFVLWALADNGYTGAEMQKGLAYVKANLGNDSDSYTLGLVGNAFASAAPNDAFLTTVLAKLDSLKKTDGKKISWDSDGTQTNFYGGGNDAAVSATALVARAMLLAGGYKTDVDGALEYLVGSKDPQGNFGSTQATIWTLRTLILAAEKGTEGAVGSLEVDVDGSPFTTLALTADKPDVMTTVDMKSLASLGTHQVSLTFVGTGKVSYNLVSRYNIPWTQVPPDTSGPLAVSVSYDKSTLAVNDMVQATVAVQNKTASVQNMVILTVGIPPGFAVQTDDLDAYKTSGQLSTYEVTGKQLTFYMSALPPNGTITYKYHLLATMPVKASDGGATAYLYYQPEQKTSAPSATLEVTAN